MRKGILFIVSGFSGAGKGTVLKEVFKAVDNLSFSVSATSRKPRDGEVNGVHYHFFSKEEFEKMISDGLFAEHACTFGNYYGTLKSEIDKSLSSGKDMIFDINFVGAENMKKAYPESVSIFITPPSIKDLKERLIGRGSETEESLKCRLAEVKKEVREIEKYDYVLVNDKIDECAKNMISIILAERNKLTRNKDIISKLSEETQNDD
ncbi:MAG: guanylate kinase [Christensenellales bacterium]